MSRSTPLKKAESTQTVSRRAVLRTTGVTVGAGLVALAGTAPSGAQQTVDFGDVVVGSSDMQTVSQSNPTGQPIPITGIEITGSDADQFSVVSGDTSATLQPGESHTADIRFAPSSAGEKTATAQVNIAGGSTRTVGNLAGTGVTEATDDSTATSSSSSASEETTGGTSDDSDSSGDGSSGAEENPTDSSAGESQSSGDDSTPGGSTGDSSETTAGDSEPTPEGSPTTESDTEGSAQAGNGDGLTDCRDVVALVRVLL